jgi:hypothetical protein
MNPLDRLIRSPLMSIPILIGGLVLVVVILFFWLSSKGRFYLSHSNGFVSFGGPSKGPRKATRAQLAPAIERLTKGDRYDTLWIATDEEDSDCFGLVQEDGGFQVQVSYTLHSRRGENFKAVADKLGLPLLERQVFNEGMGEDMESEYLTFKAPNDAEELSQLAFKLVDATFPMASRETLYLTAQATKKGPLTGRGLIWRKDEDLLEGVL